MTQLESLQPEMLYRALLESTSDFVWAIDRNGRYLFINRRMERLLGISNEEAKNRYFREFASASDNEDLLAKLGRVFKGETIIHEYLGHLDNHWYLRTISPMRDASDRIVAAFILSKDITERKQIEEELRSSEEKYRNLVENSKDSIVIVDLKGNVKFANKVTEELTGHLNRLGMNVIEITPLRYWPKSLEMLLRAKMGNPIPYFESIIKRKDGSLVPVESGGQAIYKDGKVTGIQIITRDITERKRVEKELRDSEERFRIVVEDLQEGLTIIEDGETTYVNNRTCEILGYSSKELRGIDHLDLAAPEEKDRIQVIKAEARRIGVRPTELDFCIIRKDGKKRCIQNHYSNVRIRDRLAQVIVTTDITDKKRAEMKLKAYANDLENLVEGRTREIGFLSNIAQSISQAVMVQDNERKIVFANKAFEDMYGFKTEEIVGKSATILYPDAAETNKTYLEVTRALEKNGSWIGELKRRRKNGESFTLLQFASQLRDSRGAAIGIVTINTDVTEKKELELRLQQNEERLRRIVDNAPIGIVVTDNKGNLVQTNEEECRFAKASREELLKLNFFNLVDKRVFPFYEKALRGETCEYVGPYHTTLHGFDKWVRMVYAPLRDSEGKISGVVYLVEDITKRHQLEEQLLEQNHLVSIGQTALMVGHDLRNPLQAIVNNVYLAKKKIESMPSPDRIIVENYGLMGFCESVGKQAEYMNKIVSDLQDYASPLKPKFIKTNLFSFIEEMFSTLPVPENVQISTLMQQDFEVPIDPELMMRVFINLVTNAIQAMPNGGQLTIRAVKTDEYDLVSVEDTGVGISEDNLPKLFQPLFTTKAKGQGLGLAVCKRIVEAHGGEITVKSEEGRGSIFTVKIPLKTEVNQT